VRLLKLMGDTPAAFYEDACRFLDERPGLASASHLVGHLAREIECLVRDLLTAMVPPVEWERLEADPRPEGQHDPDRAAVIDAICTALGFSDDDEVRRLWKRTNWQRGAHRGGLLQPRPADAELRSRWVQFEGLLLRIGRQYEASFTAALPVVDQLATIDAPTKEDLKRLRTRVPHSDVAMKQFFSRAGAGWFALLRGAGYLTNPRSLTPSEDGYVTYVPWPAAGYLVRMSALEQLSDQVVDLALGLETDNPEAAECIADIARAVPSARARRLVPKIVELLGQPVMWRLPPKAAGLATQLAADGDVNEAIGLLKPLLPRPSRVAGHGHGVPPTVVTGLLPGLGLPGLVMLADRLRDTAADETDRATLAHSRIWRPSIDSSHDHSGRDLLVSMLRDGGVRVAAVEGVSVVVSLLEGYDEAVFQRLSLHVLRKVPDPGLVEARLASRGLFDRYDVGPEYTLLLQGQFSHLRATAREAIIGYVDAGPQPGADPVGDSEQWQWYQLSRFGDALPDDQQSRYQALVDRFGVPAPDDEPIIFTERDLGAPVDAVAISAMSDDALIDLLTTFDAGPGREPEHSPVGLQRELEVSAAADPARFSALADRLAALDPTYAHGVFEGLTRALKEGDRSHDGQLLIDWPQVLTLGRAVIAQPRLLPGRPGMGDGERDPGWVWCRQWLANLLAEGLRTDLLPTTHADAVFQQLSQLAEDPEPASHGGDPATEAINTVRGWALIAVMRYALWRHRHRDPEQDAVLDDNVRQILDRHLDPAVDPSTAIRAVYGMHLGLLAVCDPDWTRERIGAIFEDRTAPRGLAAWNAFLQFCRPTPRTYALVANLYTQAVTDLPVTDPTPSASAGSATAEIDHVHDRLVGHLAALYTMNLVGNEDGSLLDRFLRKAPDKLKAKLVEILGIMLRNTEQPSPDVLERLQQLWQWRFDRLRSSNADLSELAGFAWWFASGKLDTRWVLRQLHDLLQAGGTVEPDHMVASELATQHDAFPDETVTCMALLIDAPTDPWFVTGSLDDIRTVLRGGLQATEQATRKKAEETINRLVARGYTSFQDLLG
jgi:hypothetical protein